MDIINKGDFAVTNYGGKTMFSFRFPACAETVYTKDSLELPDSVDGFKFDTDKPKVQEAVSS